MLLGVTGSTALIIQIGTSTLTQSYYTFQLTDKNTKVDYVFYQNNISNSPYYAKFNIINNSGSIGLTQGIVALPPSQYSYVLYEMASPYILSTASAVDVVKNGIITINGTSSTNAAYSGNDSFTFSSYKNYDRL